MPHFGIDMNNDDFAMSRIQRLDQGIRRQEPFNQMFVNGGGQSAVMENESVVD